MYQERSYRHLIQSENLVSFEVSVKETDLSVHAARPLSNEARESVLTHRGHIESYIKAHPQFLKTLVPMCIKGPAPQIVRDMSNAGIDAGVGPMAAVAGAVAEYVGRDLLHYSDEIIVENGGDIFVKLNHPFTAAIYAGESPLSLKTGILVNFAGQSIAICTSSATFGHSLSKGAADAVCVISKSCCIADAAATSICNQVGSVSQIEHAVNFGKQIKGVLGIVVIAKDKIGLWGNVEIVPIQ
jgi:ApbE superfamily uncharacterized protein (UPF0280 family)